MSESSATSASPLTSVSSELHSPPPAVLTRSRSSLERSRRDLMFEAFQRRQSATTNDASQTDDHTAAASSENKEEQQSSEDDEKAVEDSAFDDIKPASSWRRGGSRGVGVE